MGTNKKFTQRVGVLAAVAVAGLVATFAGCDSIENSIDCSRICDKYQDCIDPNYDVSACDSRCEENGDSEDFTDRIDACESCIDDKTCGESAFSCANECVGIVP